MGRTRIVRSDDRGAFFKEAGLRFRHSSLVPGTTVDVIRSRDGAFGTSVTFVLAGTHVDVSSGEIDKDWLRKQERAVKLDGRER